MRLTQSSLWSAVLAVAAASSLALAQSPSGSNAVGSISASRVATASPASKAEQTLDTAAGQNRYTYLVFYRSDDPATRTMAQTVKDGLAKRGDKAVATYVQVGNPAEKTLVDKYDVSRAPMPLTIVVAPNGAMTGIFAQKIEDKNLDDAQVTPTMMKCMKSLQEGKLVLISVRNAPSTIAPAAVRDLQADPHFKDRVVNYAMQVSDPAEGKFLQQMQIEPAKLLTQQTVLLAPPGVLVGKFEQTASKDEIANALAKAGKCCDDVNCKHHQQQAPATRTATQDAGVRR